jgi:hypothetical protein
MTNRYATSANDEWTRQTELLTRARSILVQLKAAAGTERFSTLRTEYLGIVHEALLIQHGMLMEATIMHEGRIPEPLKFTPRS